MTSNAKLMELSKLNGNNSCRDCSSPMPQWASVNNGIFICLNCSGRHRGLGVQISFVRSITMDKWTDEQIAKMEKGGNNKSRAFFDQASEKSAGMSIEDLYNTLTAARYRDKLAADCEGRPWDPTAIPDSFTPSDAASSSSTLRKPRAAGLRAASPSPRPLSPGAVGAAANPYSSDSQKAQNEAFFSGLGSANASRSADLPPSQGGKYAGFGPQPDYVPSAATSSKAVPSLDDFRDDPVTAFSKGWGFFTTTVAQATKTINDSVIQPGLEKAVDPNLRNQLGGYLNTAGERLADAGRQGGTALSGAMRSGGDYAKGQGYDFGDMGASYIDKLSVGGSTRSQYTAVNSTQALNSSEAGEVDFFESNMGASGQGAQSSMPSSIENSPSEALLGGGKQPAAARSLGARRKPAAKGDDDWDSFGGSDWKDD